MSEMQKDLVLAPNEYSYVLDETKGNISCNVGPHKMSLSQSDKLVKFDHKTKKFVPCERYEDAIQLFTTIPGGWYVALKNPTIDNSHPLPGTSNNTPDKLQIGRKINIPGPANFALYPGQMADVIKGHTLRSNQYLVARVYDADTLNVNPANSSTYINGQVLIIKGTEVPFYIPPTGIEVKPINNDKNKGYVRDAVTLEKLEYCILKDEDGNKRYVHGPEVVFPKPTESFLQDGNGNIKRNAIELSEISGVYVKVIADYEDEDGTEHKTGEELFITGKEQMIYYPRQEHTFITYNGRIMHHAIAIPEGQGRYVLNRLTGEIKTVKGPAMYLPDPRVEVVTRRELTLNECQLWYPGNKTVLAANGYGEQKPTNDTQTLAVYADDTMHAKNSYSLDGTPIKKEKNTINRSNTFTPPRTISLDSSKYSGAVSLDVWPGYAVNVISKNGNREVVKGPKTILLDYDQTLEVLKTGLVAATAPENTVFLPYKNNNVTGLFVAMTSDFIQVTMRMSFNISFDEDVQEKWFAVNDYVSYLQDWVKNKLKTYIADYTITEFYNDYNNIVFSALNPDMDTEKAWHYFDENGMLLNNAQVISIHLPEELEEKFDKERDKIVTKELQLSISQNALAIEEELTELERRRLELKNQLIRQEASIRYETHKNEFEIRAAINADNYSEALIESQHRAERQKLDIVTEDIAREQKKKDSEAKLAELRERYNLDIEREAKSAEAMKTILESLGPDLAAAMNNANNQKTIEEIASAISPYALANNESVSNAVSTLLRGTPLEQILFSAKNKN